MHYVGIDVGLGGAIASISDTGAMIVQDVPTVTVSGRRGGTSKKQEYLPTSIVAMLEPYRDGKAVAVLEKVSSRPGEGSVSSFRFGRGVGLIEGILSALRIPYTTVSPVRWKKAMMPDMPKDKGSSIVRALQLFPDASLSRKKDHGRADALLLAEWLRRQQQLDRPAEES